MLIIYNSAKMLPLLAQWMLLWLRARKVSKLDDTDVLLYITKGNTVHSTLTNKIKTTLSDDHVKMLNLCYNWLSSFLPFILQKVNRVHFGLLHSFDIKMLVNEGVKIPTSRRLTAVPFVAKDVPSRASEFAHPG